MPPVADIAAPVITRRLGAVWFVVPVVLVALWVVAVPHHLPAAANRTHISVAEPH